MNPLLAWTRPDSPFHPGERALQERAGVREESELLGRRMIREFLPDQHRAFYARLPFVVTGTVDEAGQPWASLLAGEPGFVTSPDERTLAVGALPPEGDPLARTLREGARIGLLGIELETRRRNRANGTVARVGPDGFEVRIAQAFGNCPQYIQLRDREPAPAAPGRHEELASLDHRALAQLARADTFFVATAAHGEGADVSHRGGRPGFVRADGGTLTVPDFAGNNHFNTLGNLALDPRAGLLFPDFTDRTLLHLAARAEVVWGGPELAAFAGAERLVRFTVERAVRAEGALPFRWSLRGWAPQLARTGSWSAA